MIGQKYNYSDVFFRDLTVCVLAELEERLGWVNVFDDETRNVNVPIYYSLTGKEDYLLDSFKDDVAGKARKVELNTDVFPRAHITLTNWRYVSAQFTNPNIWLRMVVENESEIRKELTKIRAIPIDCTYEMSMLINSEIDTFKASEALMNALLFYQHFYFEHNFMYIDGVMVLPDENQVTINRDIDMSSDDTIKLDLSFQVQTYYPAYTDSQKMGKPKGSMWASQIGETYPKNQ